ncbi:hypothetical protein RHMOL_Rhmol07G0200000 [Rhododendron molle]|uniref:Uncharacterized protein n=1 Tax=Rhododendron molle TaxID=49168 RepID=A0ACC0N2F0_RHOML|nr:hypothetical protein RHMOL_Rhmol07G0200000 [Rhododendron molle]
MGFPAALHVDQAWLNHWEGEWNAAQADPLDGLSLFMLYHQPEPVIPEEEVKEYVWDPQPDVRQLAWGLNFNLGQYDNDNDIDEKYLSYYVEGEIILNRRRQLGAVLPIVDSISDAVHECDHGCDPTLNIVSVEESRPYVAPSDDCAIMVLNVPPDDLWDVDEIIDIGKTPPPTNLWDVDTVVDVAVGNEGLVMDDLEWDSALGQDSSATVASVNKGKRNLGDVFTDLWDFDDTSSWPNAPVAQRSAPIVPGGILEEDVIQKQLERIPVVVSIWGLISSSKENREKLSSALARLKAPTDITSEAMITIILPLLSAHSVTFTERDLPVEGTAHNRPLHITIKCRGHWVLTVLIDNGSAINVCPMRVLPSRSY